MLSHIARGAPMWDTWRGADIFFKSVYPTLILGYTELSNFEINVKNVATIGVFRV